MKAIIKYYTFFIISLITALLILGCENIELNSNWLDREITVDGNDADWKNSMTFFENTKAAIGIFNDENYLYLSICPWDTRIQNQIINNGMIVWFDPNGNYEKIFGVCFPLELEENNLTAVSRGNRKESEKYLEMFKELQNNLEIIYPGEEEPIVMSLAEAEAVGVIVGVGNSAGRLFYELRVPIRTDGDNKYAINFTGNDHINIGFETPEVDMETSQHIDTERLTRGSSGTGLVRRTRRSRVGARGTQISNLLHENLQLWTTVTLSSKPIGER